MNTASAVSVALAVGYLLGSFPVGLLTARFVGKFDIRTRGSGNTGATNVARYMGAKWGAVVLLLDALKGFVPVFVLPPLLLSSDASDFIHVQTTAGLAAILGHVFPFWLRFRGGKGVATALGVVAVLSWQALGAAFLVFLISFLAFRIVSLSSILAAVAFAVYQFARWGGDAFSRENWSLALFSLAIPLLIVVRHRSNIVLLLKGREERFRTGGPNDLSEEDKAAGRKEARDTR